jgi:putative beta-lysine N-acetyltransferase
VHPQPDTISSIGRSLVQFGNLNARVYLMKLDFRDLPGIVVHLERLAREKGLTKICAKVPLQVRSHFLGRGFVQEARVPGMFQAREDGLFLARFLEGGRERPDHVLNRAPLSEEQHDGSWIHPSKARPSGHQVRRMGRERARSISEVFQAQFSAYPFPLHDPAYVRECQRSHVSFFGIEAQGEIAALASSEMSKEAGYVEMTDFVTLPRYQGQGLATALLQAMEEEMRNLGFKTAFSIARARSAGMNAVFARQGYAFGGRLVKNTCFNGRLEDMNIWSRRL